MKENDTEMSIKTDLAHLDELADAEIDTSDIPPLTDEFFAKAEWKLPESNPQESNVHVTVAIEPEVYAWYRAQGDDFQARLAAALRLYAAVHQSASGVHGST